MYNLQGDVVGLADAATGKIIAKYLYDAWGKCVSVENADGYTIGTANPFRYRGYYYDNETGFYYLNSRYYNPEVGRFLNADAFVTTDITGALSANMFAYCENNPVNMVDPNGCDPIPSWAKRIIDGNATEADYKKALSVNPEGWGGSARNYVDLAISIARETLPQISDARDKPNFKPRKDPRKGSGERQKTGARERNVGHPNGEEHSRVPKGTPGIKHRFDGLAAEEQLVIATIAIIILCADDLVGVVADDGLLAPTMTIWWDAASKAFH